MKTSQKFNCVMTTLWGTFNIFFTKILIYKNRQIKTVLGTHGAACVWVIFISL